MSASAMAKEFMEGIRLSMTCPDVSPAEYEGVIKRRIEQLKWKQGWSVKRIWIVLEIPVCQKNLRMALQGKSWRNV